MTCADINVATVERDIVYDITSVIPVKWPVSSRRSVISSVPGLRS